MEDKTSSICWALRRCTRTECLMPQSGGRMTSWQWFKKYFGKDWAAFRHSICSNWKRRTFPRISARSRPGVGILEMSVVFFASCWTIWRVNTLQQNTDTDTVTDISSWSQVVDQFGGVILFNRYSLQVLRNLCVWIWKRSMPCVGEEFEIRHTQSKKGRCKKEIDLLAAYTHLLRKHSVCTTRSIF